MHRYTIHFRNYLTASEEFEIIRAYSAADALTIWHTNVDMEPDATKHFRKIVAMEDEK